MENYNIKLLHGGPEYALTDNNWFSIPFITLSVAKSMSGKSCSLSQFSNILMRMG